MQLQQSEGEQSVHNPWQRRQEETCSIRGQLFDGTGVVQEWEIIYPCVQKESLVPGETDTLKRRSEGKESLKKKKKKKKKIHIN